MNEIEEVVIVPKPKPPHSPLIRVIVGIVISSVVAIISVLLVMTGVRLERDACIVRAYEQRIDVDLAKKICAFGATLPINIQKPVVNAQQTQSSPSN